MKRNFLIILGAGLGVLFLFWGILAHSRKVAPSAQHHQAPDLTSIKTDSEETRAELAKALQKVPNSSLSTHDLQNIATIIAVYSAPISFWGKVVDQKQNPIADAKVHYEIIDRYFAPGTNRDGTSDANGLFSLAGVRGMGICVQVSKPGYGPLSDQSTRSFHSGSSDMPSKAAPAIFVLRKKGPIDPLICLSRDIQVPSNGDMRGYSLRQGYVVQDGHSGDILVSLEGGRPDGVVDPRVRYDWHFKIRLPNGGLLARAASTQDLEAPSEGYQPEDSIDMLKDDAHWAESVDKEYYIKLNDGHYGRISMHIAAEGHLIDMTSYFNPEPGHRSLEYLSNPWGYYY